MKNVVKMLNIAGLLAAAVVLSPVVPVDQAHAYACKGSQHEGAVLKQNKIGGKIAARKDWQSRMKVKYGLSWSTWAIAKDKSVRCHKSNGKNLCIASAKPCQYVAQ